MDQQIKFITIILIALFVGFIFDLSILRVFLPIFLFILIFISLFSIGISEFSFKKINVYDSIFLLLFAYALPILSTFLIKCFVSNESYGSLFLLNISPLAILNLPLILYLKKFNSTILFSFSISYFISFILLFLIYNLTFFDLLINSILLFFPFVLYLKLKNNVSLDSKVFDYLSNFFLFLILATSFSISKQYIFDFSSEIITILLLRNFIIPLSAFLLLYYFNFRKELIVSGTLFTFLKNSSLALILAFNLFNNYTYSIIPLTSPFFESLSLILILFLFKCVNNKLTIH